MIYNLPRKKRKRITNYLTFSSPNPFSISVATPGWNGKLDAIIKVDTER